MNFYEQLCARCGIERATHDALTSLFNRGTIMELLGREIARGRRERAPMAILLCNLDLFKSVNDTRGHLVGDQVLKEAAKRILLAVRSYDYVGRYGGEEFLVILNNRNLAAGSGRADEIRKGISSAPRETSAGAIYITTSMRVNQTDNWGNRSVDELLREVDAALYAAKAAGQKLRKHGDRAGNNCSTYFEHFAGTIYQE